MNYIKLTYFKVVLIFFVSVISHSVAKDKYSEYGISGGIYLNTNINIAKFNQIVNCPNCLNNFTSSVGLGYSIFVGIEKKSDTKLLNSDYLYSLRASFQDLSASFLQDEFFANKISGNTYVQAVSEHTLSPAIKIISIEPSIYFCIMNNFPMTIKLGFQSAFIMTSTFDQKEYLKSPTDFYFENGTKTRSVYHGPITNGNSFYFALETGIRYEAWTSACWKLYPEVNFGYGLTNVAKSLNWSISTVRTGVSLVYNHPYPAPVAPAFPPIPNPPPVPKPEDLKPIQSDINIFTNNTLIQDASKPTTEVVISEYLSQNVFLPIIFFENGTDHTMQSSDLTDKIVEYLNDNQNESICLQAYSAENESENISKTRIDLVISELEKRDIDTKRIVTCSDPIISKTFKDSPQRNEELSRIEFVFDKGNTICVLNKKKFKDQIKPLELKIIPNLSSDEKILINGNVKVGNRSYKIGLDPVIIDASPISTNDTIFDKNIPIELSAELIDQEKQVKKIYKNYSIEIEKKNLPYQILNYGANPDLDNQIIIALFSFDEAKPLGYNLKGIEFIKTALKEGKTVEIRALTDNIGTVDHNSRLAGLRAKVATDLFSEYKSQLKIEIPDHFIYPNDTPLGRMRNRSVIAKIID